MISDNGTIIKSKLRNDGRFASWADRDGRMVYKSLNRKARRYLESGSFKTIAKNKNLDLDLENYTVR